MKTILGSLAVLTVLGACAQRVPDSGAAVGFADPNDYILTPDGPRPASQVVAATGRTQPAAEPLTAAPIVAGSALPPAAQVDDTDDVGVTSSAAQPVITSDELEAIGIRRPANGTAAPVAANAPLSTGNAAPQITSS
ncbi:hypothetical protein [Pelagovum pacificum]|uniref:DUF3035 domain-containing protein n=1 Tax=Pelagovum pacificum TaxID=2588711 RepID=A0A5C5GA75_9RHOB|nr:hypothetical protein [Pelagovum pacificum]QQA41593.1 hypothetical protein I8N54_12260 [Pelagovum pacificum]TNY30872.1 hypothetical protein FHY64_17335 [Pelagovum pacificum]